MAKGINAVRDISPEKIPEKITEATLRMPREDELAQKEISDCLKALAQIDRDLVDLRAPVKRKEAEIKTTLHEMEKKGYFPDVIKSMHKAIQKGKLTAEYRITWNSYIKSAKVPLPLFDVTDTAQH